MDCIKFKLPESTVLVSAFSLVTFVEGPEFFHSYFQEFILPKLLELGFVLETEAEFEKSNIYYKEKLTEKEKEDFVNIIENSKYFYGMFIYYAHKSNKESKRINVKFWKSVFILSIFPISLFV
jgi:hypothetical protein